MNQEPALLGVGKERCRELFNGYKVSVWDDEKVLKMDGGDGCTALWMSLMSVTSTLKSG